MSPKHPLIGFDQRQIRNGWLLILPGFFQQTPGNILKTVANLFLRTRLVRRPQLIQKIPALFQKLLLENECLLAFLLALWTLDTTLEEAELVIHHMDGGSDPGSGLGGSAGSAEAVQPLAELGLNYDDLPSERNPRRRAIPVMQPQNHWLNQRPLLRLQLAS